MNAHVGFITLRVTDPVLAEAERAGGEIVTPAQEARWSASRAPCCGLPALQALGVDLEEAPSVGPQRRGGQVSPERAHLLGLAVAAATLVPFSLAIAETAVPSMTWQVLAGVLVAATVLGLGASEVPARSALRRDPSR